MKRSLTYWGLAVFLLFTASVFVSCSTDDPIEEITETPVPQPGDEEDGNENDNGNNEDTMERHLTITINGMAFTATLADNDAANAFADLLPLTLNMNEMNGNEKYHYLDNSLPTDSYRPGIIQTGDLMLYGSSCIVLFYETFSSGYSYTRLGRIDNPEGLATAVGNGNVSVSFTIAENPANSLMATGGVLLGAAAIYRFLNEEQPEESFSWSDWQSY